MSANAIHFDAASSHALRMVQAHRRAMYRAKDPRVADKHREEVRSYAVELANAILALNPHLVVADEALDRIVDLNCEVSP